jgi:hypothetical protein
MNFSKAMSLVLAATLALSGPATALAQESGAASTPAGTSRGQETGKSDSGDAAYKIGAGVATAINIPLRSVLCVAGGGIGLLVMVITLGSGYRAATHVVEEGCGGPWLITSSHLKGTERSKSDSHD